MNKFLKNIIINLSIWLVSFIILIIIIVCRLNQEIEFQLLKYPFTILFFCVPFILSAHIVWTFNNVKSEDINKKYIMIPFVGLSLFTTLSLINLINNVVEKGKTYLLLAVALVYVYNIVAILYLYKTKYGLRKHVLITIFALIMFIVFNVVGIYASYYYSIMW